jgi:hypothetical protein
MALRQQHLSSILILKINLAISCPVFLAPTVPGESLSTDDVISFWNLRGSFTILN